MIRDMNSAGWKDVCIAWIAQNMCDGSMTNNDFHVLRNLMEEYDLAVYREQREAEVNADEQLA